MLFFILSDLERLVYFAKQRHFQGEKGMDASIKLQQLVATLIIASLVLLTSTKPLAAQETRDTVIELTAKDRAFLEQILGEGVVGKAIAGGTISDPLRFFPLEEGTWIYRITSGKDKNKSEQQLLTRLMRDRSGSSWRQASGTNSVLYLLKTASGSVEIVSTEDQQQGVISRYLPREPILLPGMRPGDTKLMKTDVEVYDLSHPDHLSHSGSLSISYSYLGSYEVTVPAGTFQAALFKWDYKGKVGPARVEDVQYRFFAEEVGTLAMIEKTDVTALLVYREHTKIGKVLIKKQ
jgi:hypothetical protein